jgi:predicted DCC family thiol-disulfide oxidoreductase YuxK
MDMSAEPETKERWVLFYDGTCNFCHASMKKVKEWARRTGKPLDVHTLQSPLAKERGYGENMILEADGRVYEAGDAWLRVMAIAPWYLRWITLMRHTGFTKWLAKMGYNFVARNRHLWMGKRALEHACATGG